MTIRPRKEILKRGEGGVTEGMYIFFSLGDFFEGEYFAKEKSEEELRNLWKKNEAAITERYLEEMKAKGWSGNRPWSWWKWSCPPDEKKAVPPKEYDSQKVWDERRGKHGWWESDFEFLARLNLLEPWEMGARGGN